MSFHGQVAETLESRHGSPSSPLVSDSLIEPETQRKSLKKRLFAPFGRVSGPLKKVWEKIGSTIAGNKKAAKVSDSDSSGDDSSCSNDEISPQVKE